MTNDDSFRYMNGGSAKRIGKCCDTVRVHPTQDELRVVYKAKLEAHPRIQKLLNENTLQLVHYYVFGNKVVIPKEWEWTATLWNEFK